MRDFVYGDDVVVEAYKDTGYFPFACVKSVAINMRSSLLPSSVPDSGAWEEFVYAGKNGWDITLTGVLVLEDSVDALWFGWELLLLQLRTVGMNIKVKWKDRKGVEKYATGKAMIPESGTTGDSGDFSGWSLRLVGTGPLDVNGIIVPPINPKNVRIDWTATGAEPNVVQDNRLIGISLSQIKHVSWEGDDKFRPINTGSPTDKQVKHDAAAGTLTFLNNFTAADYIYAIIEEA